MPKRMYKKHADGTVEISSGMFKFVLIIISIISVLLGAGMGYGQLNEQVDQMDSTLTAMILKNSETEKTIESHEVNIAVIKNTLNIIQSDVQEIKYDIKKLT